MKLFKVLLSMLALVFLLLGGSVFAMEKSVHSSVQIHSESSGGDSESRAEIYMRTSVNGEVEEFHRILEGEELENFEKTMGSDLDNGSIHFEIRTDNDGMTDSSIKVFEEKREPLNIFSRPGTSEDPKRPRDAERLNKTESFKVESELSGSLGQLSGLSGTSTSSSSGETSQENTTISYLQKIFAYVLSIFS